MNDLFADTSGWAAWGVGPGEAVVGHLANNSREKGSVDLLKAAQRAWQRGHRFRLVLAGPEMPNFKTFWRHYSAAERVLRLGVLDDRQKRDFFAGLDVFALPSRSRLGWCCWRRGPTGRRTWRTGPAAWRA